MKKRPLGFVCVLVILVQVFLVMTGVRGTLPAVTGLKESDSVSAAGQVYRSEKRASYQLLYIQDTEISYQDKYASQLNLIVYDREFTEVSLGNTIYVRGNPSFFEEPRNPGNYDQKFYYTKEGISFALFAEETEVIEEETWEIRQFLADLRGKWHGRLLRVLGEKDGGMLSAMMLGERADLDREEKERYQVNGIGHLLAISGLHLSFIGSAFYGGLRRAGLPYIAAGILGGLFLSAYAVMTGLSVSTMRALVMFLIRTGADLSGRVYDLMTGLLVAAAMIVCENPLYVKDAGFLLSFGAILGLLLLLPVTEKIFPCPWKWLGGFYASVAIQLFLFPVTLYFFFEIPVYSVLINVLAIPLMSLLLGVGFTGSVIAFFAPGAGEMVLSAAKVIFRVYDWLCDRGLDIPGARLTAGKPEWYQVAVCYLFLLLFLWIVGKRDEKENGKQKKKQSGWGKCGRVVVLFLILGISWPFSWNFGRVEVTMLDAGQGDGIYMKGPSGLHYFIDGGSSDVKEVGRYRIEPFLKSRGVGTLDYVFISHGDADHISGIREMLARQKVGIRIQALVLPVREVWDESLEELARTAEKYRTKVMVMERGSEMKEGDFSVRCVQPGEGDGTESGNAASMVLAVNYGEFDLLLTGDVEGRGEELLSEGRIEGPLDVLKVAHHGSRNSSGEEFLETAAPRIGLLSAGRDNSYGHPHKETLERLKESGTKVYNTQVCGAVTIRTDGRTMEIGKTISDSR